MQYFLAIGVEKIIFFYIQKHRLDHYEHNQESIIKIGPSKEI